MGSILQVLLSSHVVLFFLALLTILFLVAVIIKKIKRHPNLFLGINGLIQSPSGVFGLLTLAAITFVTFKQPTVGGVAFAAFVGVVPAILAIAEHRETLAGISQIAPPTYVAPPTVTVAPPTANLPSRGTL